MKKSYIVIAVFLSLIFVIFIQIKKPKINSIILGQSIDKIKTDWEVTVLLVSPQYIKKLNQKYRHKNKVTDVLSFSQKEGSKLILPGQKTTYLAGAGKRAS